jgi:hypothetical protein
VGGIIDEEEEIAASTRHDRSHKTTEVFVHELKSLGGAVVGLMWEGTVPLFGHHTGVVELLDVVDVRQATDHLLLAKLF